MEDNYFHFIPIELNELIILYMDNTNLESFISLLERNKINWNMLFYSHFGYKKNVNYEEYLTYLSIEKLKRKLNLDYTLEGLINLEILNLGNNKLNKLPKEIGNLFHLKKLILSHNKLKKLPIEIGGLYNLVLLDLSYNELIEIPKEMGKLKKLLYLELNNNKLTNLPKEMGDIQNLQNLNISDTEIKKSIKEIKNLFHLSLLLRITYN